MSGIDMRHVLFIVMQLASICLFSLSSLAETFPYSGFFLGMRVPDMPQEELKARCALHFIEMKSDGTSRSYHIDLEHFTATGKIKYFWFSNTVSHYDSRLKIELMQVEKDGAFPQGEGRIYYYLIREITKDAVLSYSFANKFQAAKAATTGDTRFGEMVALVRCPFPDKLLRQFISDEFTMLGIEDIANITSPMVDLHKTKTGLEILKTLEQE
jgi:hypothetical protein